MMIRPLVRWLAASLACWLVIAPTIAGLAHERAHHPVAGHHARSSGDHDHGSEPDPELPETGSDPSVSGDHADSSHQAARIGSGLSARADHAFAGAGPIDELGAGVVVRFLAVLGPLDRQPDQTHHPPGLPRAPPRH